MFGTLKILFELKEKKKDKKTAFEGQLMCKEMEELQVYNLVQCVILVGQNCIILT